MGPLYDSLGGISSVSICSAGSWYGFIRSTWTTSLSFLFVKQDQNLVLRKSRLINGVAPDTVRNTFLRVFGETDFSLEYKPIRDLRERMIPFGVWNRNVDDLVLSQSVHSG
ncbi:hypothetical protein TNCV_458151 [Trichonephila clavipes]|nr:hypothetical protein TNCV_458151 [Trichonephila clavipes]